MMLGNPNNHASRLLIYVVALFSGLTLGVTLVFIAWDSALEDNRKSFSFESSKIRESVAHNVKVSNDIINSFATFIDINEKFYDTSNTLRHQIFQPMAKEILDQELFIEGIHYYPLPKTANKSNPNLSPENEYYRFRDPQKTIRDYNIRGADGYEAILKSLYLNDWAEPIVSVFNLESGKYYVLFKAMFNEGYVAAADEKPEESIRGILSLLINPEKLIQNSGILDTLKVDLYSESSSLSGRQLIYDSPTKIRNDTMVSNFNYETLIQFASYSIRLSIAKNVYWSEINRAMIYIALLIGTGITLLLMSLVRAKDLRERELSERNTLIELQVEKQTEELALARDKALEASLIKSDFLASMSHEIRTPLTAIIGMAELLSDTKLDSDQEKYVKIFRKAGDTLLSLVNDILDLSKIEAGQLILENISFDLLEIVEESVEIYAIKAAKNDVELVSNFESTMDMRRTGDPARLRQIILNLISNAIKFTESGYISIMVSNSDSDSDEVQVSVNDTGIGISEKKQQEIFSSFTQADSSTTRKYGGTGLGLTISKYLVEMMNGRIWVESKEGVGSTFSFSVNLPINNSATRNDLRLDTFLEDKTVLVLDSNKYNRTKIFNVLHAYGAKCTESERFLSLDKYQYVFLDHKILFQCNDSEIKKILQSSQSDSAPVIIAMLDPISLYQQINRINELKLDGYLTKPIKQSDLLHVFSNKNETSEEDTNSNEQYDSEINKTPIEKKHILLVEDNKDNRLLVRTYLKKFPYITIDEAENGKTGIELYRNNTYDLILMDIQMPIMDGREAARAIRALEAESGRPSTTIIALTAHATKEEIDKCMAAGFDTHVGKPIKKSTVIGIIENFIT